MSFLTWLRSKFTAGTIPLSRDDMQAYADEYATLAADVYIREMAFWSATNLIANAVSKCEFKTFENDKEVKGREYYLWNIEPNKNQNSSAFLQKLISQLYRYNEALVIEQNGQLLVADVFTRVPHALYDDVFSQVTVSDFTFNKIFYQADVLYFRRSQINMKTVLDGLYESYAKLIGYSMTAYQRSRGTKGVFKYNTLPVAGTAQRIAFDALINEKIGKWLAGDNAALPLGEGQDWKTLSEKTYASESTRDIRAQIDDICDFTARGFGIPAVLLRGDVQGTADAVDKLLTFGIDPLVDMLAEEINRKRNGYSGFSQGTYLVVDTTTIKHIDLLSVSTAIDKLIGSGAFCVNDIRRKVGEPIIDEPWAWQHWVTKNYDTITNALVAAAGGGTDAKTG